MIWRTAGDEISLSDTSAENYACRAVRVVCSKRCLKRLPGGGNDLHRKEAGCLVLLAARLQQLWRVHVL